MFLEVNISWDNILRFNQKPMFTKLGGNGHDPSYLTLAKNSQQKNSGKLSHNVRPGWKTGSSGFFNGISGCNAPLHVDEQFYNTSYRSHEKFI